MIKSINLIVFIYLYIKNDNVSTFIKIFSLKHNFSNIYIYIYRIDTK